MPDSTGTVQIRIRQELLTFLRPDEQIRASAMNGAPGRYRPRTHCGRSTSVTGQLPSKPNGGQPGGN